MTGVHLHRLARSALILGGAAVLGFALVWSFLAYRDPDLVLNFASLLQSCGIAPLR